MMKTYKVLKGDNKLEEHVIFSSHTGYGAPGSGFIGTLL